MTHDIPSRKNEPDPDWSITSGTGLDEAVVERLVEVMGAGHEQSQPELFGDTEDDFVQTLRRLKEELSIPNGASIVYPGSSTHVGVARVFGSKNVIHVDPDESACQALIDGGYNATPVGFEDFYPDEPVDGIVALNSYGVPDKESIRRVVKPGGFIVTNNYTHWADELTKVEGVNLVEAVLPDYHDDNAIVYRGDDIPRQATGLGFTYIKVENGTISKGTVEDHTFADQVPNYPDALFVFRLTDT